MKKLGFATASILAASDPTLGSNTGIKMYSPGRVGAILLLMQLGLIMAAQAVLAAERNLKIVAFGTSLTARGGWPQALEAALRQCLGHPVAVTIVARSGATSDWGVQAIDRVISQTPDIVLAEFYANDAALNRFFSIRRSRENLGRMADDLRARMPGVRVFVMAMNPMAGLRGLIRPLLNHYAEAHRDVALEKGLDYVDHRPAWRRLSEARLAAAIPDGVHPLPDAAAAIIVPTLVSRITSGRCQEKANNAYGQ